MNSSQLLFQEEPKPAGKQELQAVTKGAASHISCSSDSPGQEVTLLQHSRQAKAQTDQTSEDISCFLRQQMFSNQQNHPSEKPFTVLIIKQHKHKQRAENMLPWDWSLQSGHAGNPGILGPPPSGHWCRAAWPRRQLQFSSHRGPHPSDTCGEARTGTRWFYPRGCSPWCARPGHGSEGLGPHSPAPEHKQICTSSHWFPAARTRQHLSDYTLKARQLFQIRDRRALAASQKHFTLPQDVSIL